MTEIQPYTPFLKLKQNEIMALKELGTELRNSITPFFDFPKKDYSENQFIADTTRRSKQVVKHLGKDYQIYLDDYDTDDMQVGSIHSYEYLLSEFSKLDVIPVSGIDRTNNHSISIKNSKRSGYISTDIIAFRITQEYFQSYNIVEEDIADVFDDLLGYFDKIDLIFDCRVCRNFNSATTANHINRFAAQFAAQYPLNKIITTGSSIPSNISEICPASSDTSVNRIEVAIFHHVRASYKLDNSLIPGDYATVSPDYSEIEVAPEILPSIMTSKLIYSHDKEHHIWRGGSLRTNGYDQYNSHVYDLILQSFYRGRKFSWADNQFYQKQHDISGFNAGSMIKHSVNAHITFMIKTGI